MSYPVVRRDPYWSRYSSSRPATSSLDGSEVVERRGVGDRVVTGGSHRVADTRQHHRRCARRRRRTGQDVHQHPLVEPPLPRPHEQQADRPEVARVEAEVQRRRALEMGDHRRRDGGRARRRRATSDRPHRMHGSPRSVPVSTSCSHLRNSSSQTRPRQCSFSGGSSAAERWMQHAWRSTTRSREVCPIDRHRSAGPAGGTCGR